MRRSVPSINVLLSILKLKMMQVILIMMVMARMMVIMMVGIINHQFVSLTNLFSRCRLIREPGQNLWIRMGWDRIQGGRSCAKS